MKIHSKQRPGTRTGRHLQLQKERGSAMLAGWAALTAGSFSGRPPGKSCLLPLPPLWEGRQGDYPSPVGMPSKKCSVEKFGAFL